MATIGFASSLKTLIKSAKTVMVVAPAAIFGKHQLPPLLGKKNDELLAELAREIKPGDLGSAGTTLTGREPRTLAIGVLPDSVSRYNAPSRAECVRRVVGQVARGKGKLGIILVLDHADHLLPQAIAIARCFPQFSGKSQPGEARRVQILAIDRQGQPIKPPARTTSTIAAVRDSAELVDMPPSDLDPDALSARARALLEPLGSVTIEEFVGDELLDKGLRGIHAVGRCALAPPRLLVARYQPKRPSGRHLALVGKGISYDTGGLHIKPRGSMEGMKGDMGGAAAVLGAFRVLVQAECPHALSLVLCIAENAIGPAAYKPDDILTMHSGKTVEINNTDAEGRILLADGVSWAARVLEADTIIDAATLTGAQMVATGLLHAAIISNDAALEAHLIVSGSRSGDLVHPLPFAPELYRAEFSSVVADMCNSVHNRNNAQSACAAQFVYNHLEGVDVKWAHVDLAGPSFPKDRATGYGVALLAQAVLDL
ncbi:M17 family metallopeptidase [Nannocystaceae bacterium ST9]